ncbi:MAG: DUF4062 domain-containing protein [Lachnospiraceae bacterium]|nr:DUF4062 domain-containing protein [Lachnospiraceae bacterium]
MNKKLQVFVSSTYTDLIDERQAAVEAILDAGHIPAGMELFKAGNESQLKTIYKWIDNSDVYMLILGGRYGSIEQESNMSYTELEYRYALSKNIPVFAVVLSESFLKNKINVFGLSGVLEQKAPEKYQAFKSFVMSKIIREVNDCKDIKIAIHSTLNEFLNEYNLTGWVRNTDENDTVQLLKDKCALAEENHSLNKEIQQLQEQLRQKAKEQFGNYSFDELVTLFKNKTFTMPPFFSQNNKETTINALDFFIKYFDILVTGVLDEPPYPDGEAFIFYDIAPYYVSFDFLERVKLPGTAQRMHTTKLGSAFYAMLEAKNMTHRQ